MNVKKNQSGRDVEKTGSRLFSFFSWKSSPYILNYKYKNLSQNTRSYFR